MGDLDQLRSFDKVDSAVLPKVMQDASPASAVVLAALNVASEHNADATPLQR